MSTQDFRTRTIYEAAAHKKSGNTWTVGEDGFEPSKSKTTDLQSAPFGHSGTLPYLICKMELVDGRNLFSKVCHACGIAATHFAIKNITL